MLSDLYYYLHYHLSSPIGFMVLFSLLFLFGYRVFRWVRKKRYNPKDAAREAEEEWGTPKEHPSESPLLYERVKKVLGLRYGADELDIKSLNTNITEHRFWGLHTVGELFIVFCEDEERTTPISIKEQNNIYRAMDTIYNDLKKEGRVPNRKYFYYIVRKGEFVHNPARMFFGFDENSFLKHLVHDHFKQYSRQLIVKYEQPLKQNYDKSLASTFILPLKENAPLSTYLDTWLTEDTRKQITLMGDYGMGKTTFVTYYAHLLAKRVLDILSVQEGTPYQKIERFPVVVNLKNLMANGLEAHLSKEITSLGLNFDLFKILIQRGMVVFLLDGFDEMGFRGEHTVRSTFKEIWNLFATQKNKMILTGRPSYFEHKGIQAELLRQEGHSSIEPYSEKIAIESLSKVQIEEYITKWYPNDAEKYIQVIEENASLKNLAVRPYLCSIIANEIDAISTDKKTTDWSETILIEKYMNNWIERQIAGKKIEETGYGLSEKEKQGLIWSFSKKLAMDCYLKDTMELNASSLQHFLDDFLEEAIKEQPKLKKLDSNGKESLKRELRVGYFLQRNANNEWEFVSKVFYEYLVAEKIMDLFQNKKGNLKHPIFRKKWTDEIAGFIEDLIPQEHKDAEKDYNIPALLILLNGRNNEKAAKEYEFYIGNSILASFFGVNLISMFLGLCSYGIVFLVDRFLVELSDLQKIIYTLIVPTIFFVYGTVYILYLRRRLDRPYGIVAFCYHRAKGKQIEYDIKDIWKHHSIILFGSLFLFIGMLGLSIALLLDGNSGKWLENVVLLFSILTSSLLLVTFRGTIKRVFSGIPMFSTLELDAIRKKKSADKKQEDEIERVFSKTLMLILLRLDVIIKRNSVNKNQENEKIEDTTDNDKMADNVIRKSDNKKYTDTHEFILLGYYIFFLFFSGIFFGGNEMYPRDFRKIKKVVGSKNRDGYIIDSYYLHFVPQNGEDSLEIKVLEEGYQQIKVGDTIPIRYSTGLWGFSIRYPIDIEK